MQTATAFDASPGEILLLAALATVITLAISVLTACAVAIRGMTSPARTIVGAPPATSEPPPISVPCGTGQALAGWFAPGRPGRGAVLLLHGIRSDRRALATRMTMLARSGMAVLAIDFRAHGESVGKAITLGHLELRDVAAALAWLRETAPKRADRRQSASRWAAPRCCSRVRPHRSTPWCSNRSTPTSTRRIANRMTCVLGLRLGPALTPLFTRIGMGLTGLHPSWLRPIEALAHITAPC